MGSSHWVHVYVPYSDYCDGIRFKTPCIHTYTYIAYAYASSCHALICNVTFGFKRAPANRNRRRTRGLLKTIACTMRRAHMSGALKAGTARESLSLSSSPRSLSLRPPAADVRRINIHYTTAAERIAPRWWGAVVVHPLLGKTENRVFTVIITADRT